MAFPKCFDDKVDLRKVQLEVVHQWVHERVTQLLGFEDDIVASLVVNLLEPKVDERLDPRQLQVAITGFLESDAPAFAQELWELLLSAQANPTGIPTQLLEQKKRELEQLASEKEKLRQVLEQKRHDANVTTATTAFKTADNGERWSASDGQDHGRNSREAGGSGRQEPLARGREDSRDDSWRKSPRRSTDQRSRDRSPSTRRRHRRSRSPPRWQRRRRSSSRSQSRSRSASTDRRRHRRCATVHGVRSAVALAIELGTDAFLRTLLGFRPRSHSRSPRRRSSRDEKQSSRHARYASHLYRVY